MKQKTGRKLLSFLLTLAMVLGMFNGIVPGMSITAQAADNTERLLTTITATGKTTYGQSVEGVVTVTLTNIRRYDGMYGWLYYGTITVEPVEGYTITKCRFIQNAKTPLDDDLAPFSIVMNDYNVYACSVDTSTGQKYGTSGMDGVTSIEVYGYANKAAQTITAADVTATYGDTDKSVSASVTTPTTGGGAISYAVKEGSGDYIDVDATTGALTIKKAGTATVVVTAAETQTHAAATKEVTVTISTKAITVNASGYTGYYDEQAHGITVTVTDPASGYTVKYGTVEGTYDQTVSPTQTEAGTLTVYYQVTADNYTTKTGSATVTISDKGTQTITASDVTATYGDTDKKVEATSDGNGTISYAVKDGSADYIDVDASAGALTIKKVGTATVVVTAAETSTYAKATKEVTVTINKANAVAATVTANSRTYDGTDKPLVTVTGTPTGGEMQYALGTETEATQPYTTSIPTATDART